MAVWSAVRVSQMTPDLRWDSEHYRPEYLIQEKALSSVKSVPLSDTANISDGNHLSIAEEFCDEGVRYLRGQDLSDFFISDSDPIYIPGKFYSALVRSHMLPGDVLLGIVGTIGSVALVTDKYPKLTGNCKLAIIRGKRLPGEYIATYLASSLGQNEIARRIRGAVQMGLILPDIKELPIIDPPSQVLTKIVSLVKGAYKAQKKSASTIEDAQQLILEVLGLDHLESATQKCYSRTFSELQTEARFDAEYFSPKYQRIIKRLREEGRTISSVANLSERAFTSTLERKSQTFRYIEIGSLTGDGRAEFETVEVADAPSRATWIVKPGDIITSTVRPIRRLSAMISEDQDGCVCSSGFAVLTPKPGHSGIEPEVLLTYLRLPIICEVLDLYTTASMYPAIPVQRLMQIPILVPDKVVRKQIVAKVQASFEARCESARLLNLAKQTVEDMITSASTRKGR